MAKAKNVKEIEEDEVMEEEQQDEEGDEEENEYEIEAILNAKPGMFGGNKIGYLVKWKGYDESENSWVNEEDAEGAADLIEDYWKRHSSKKAGPKQAAASQKASAKSSATPVSAATKKRASPEEEPDSASVPPKKRGRPPKEKPAVASESEEEKKPVSKAPAATKGRKSTGQTAASKKSKVSDAMDEDEQEFGSMKKWLDSASWEHLVDHIDTVEKNTDGTLWVYFQLNDRHGRKMCREDAGLCRKKMPNLLLDFYENNLRWRPFVS